MSSPITLFSDTTIQTLSPEERVSFLQQEFDWLQTLLNNRTESNHCEEGDYHFPDRALVNSSEWEFLCQCAEVNQSYGHFEGESRSIKPSHGGFENAVFAIRPYDWNEPDVYLPNFEYKPLGIKIWWYKYAFRASSMNYPLSADELRRLFRFCAAHLSNHLPDIQPSLTVQELIELLQAHFNGDELLRFQPEFDPLDSLVLKTIKKEVHTETNQSIVVFELD